MPPTINYLTGDVVGVNAGGALAAASGKFTRKANVVKMTNSTGGGYQQVEAGVKSASGDCSCVFKAASGVILTEGVKVALTVVAAGGQTLTTDALISEITDSWSAEGEYGYSFTWESDGEFTYAATTP